MRDIYRLLHRAAHNAPSGISVKQLADEFGIHTNTLNQRLQPENDRMFPVEHLGPICLATGDYAPLKYACEQAKSVCITLPEAVGTPYPVHRQCMEAVRRFGFLMEECADALEDGRITVEESDRLHDAGYEAMRSIVLLLVKVKKEAV